MPDDEGRDQRSVYEWLVTDRRRQYGKVRVVFGHPLMGKLSDDYARRPEDINIFSIKEEGVDIVYSQDAKTKIPLLTGVVDEIVSGPGWSNGIDDRMNWMAECTRIAAPGCEFTINGTRGDSEAYLLVPQFKWPHIPATFEYWYDDWAMKSIYDHDAIFTVRMVKRDASS